MQDPQEAIANHLHGGLLVLAPVGTGKTYALTERVARALEARFAPERILCLTFTNRAAQEVRDRLAQHHLAEMTRPTIQTFHALCAAILRSDAKRVGLATDFTVCDDSDSIDQLQEVGPRDRGAATDLYHEIARLKSAVESRNLTWPPRWEQVFAGLGPGGEVAERYQLELRLQHKLDYADLVLFANSLLACERDVRERWEQRFDLVQVDEVQDTHRSEYRVVWVLTRCSGNLALFGDLDQTIYGWRGSDPDAVLNRFQQDFAPITTLSLTKNRRASRRLVRAAALFAESFSAQKRVVPSDDREEGESIVLYRAPDTAAEARWIGERIAELASGNDFRYSQVAVLTRVNEQAIDISKGLDQLAVPHVTVESFEFFRRQEIKDALAPLRLVLNPADNGAVIRVLERLAQGVGSGRMARIRKAGEPIGLRLIDLLRPETHAFGDPFGQVIEAYRRGSLVVFDVESTGLSTTRDDVVEIAAMRLVNGEPADSFHVYLRNERPVGDSFNVHGWSDEFLASHGRPPAEALADFFAFCQGDLVVGHNVFFDLRIIAAQALRLGLPAPTLQCADTLALAQRFAGGEQFRLDLLGQELNLRSQPSHHAEDDVRATCDLLGALVPRAEGHADARRALVEREAPAFLPLTERLSSWRSLAGEARPAELLARVLDESGLNERYDTDPRRLAHLVELQRVLETRDDGDLDPVSALEEIVYFTALAKNVEHVDQHDERVRIITIHQAKGLEFDTVFVAGLADGSLPYYRSVREGRLEEERRLFYVALTRARRRLYLSLSASSHYGKPTRPSQFLACIDPELLQPI